MHGGMHSQRSGGATREAAKGFEQKNIFLGRIESTETAN
jgi:hypothetical protein